MATWTWDVIRATDDGIDKMCAESIWFGTVVTSSESESESESDDKQS